MSVGRHGGAGVLQRKVAAPVDMDGGVVQRVSEDGANQGDFGGGEITGHGAA